MKKLFFATILFSNLTVYCQSYCPGSYTPYYLNSNHIRASFLPRGNKFIDGANPGFQVPFPAHDLLSTIFASSIWIGGFDDADNYKLAAEYYPTSTRQDFNVGPLNSIGLPFDSICSHYDNAWSVYYEDIIANRNDWYEDFNLDDTIPSIFKWPGRGNKHFKKYFGFDLPNDNQGLAPFYDYNGDNIYDPEDGDYPCVLNPNNYLPIIPDQILWMVFNDVDAGDSLNPGSLRFEIQLTAFAFHCQDKAFLNNTIFNSYKIINRAVLAADSVFFGIWTDYDLGCPSDDFIGCDTLRNTEFVYNADAIDGDILNQNECISGEGTFHGIPPVQSLTYLNYPMHSFMLAEPLNQGLSFYRQLNGQWANGAKIWPHDDGHGASDTLSSTRFLYSGDPRDSASWSANNVNMSGSDMKTISSVKLGRMDPGAVKNVRMAYMFHSDTSLAYLDQITLMKEDIDSLFSFLDYPYTPCMEVAPCVGEDCVWPGDFDHNGIADHRDYLYWGVFNGLIGPTRDGPAAWRGQFGENWEENNAGINAKFGDGDGNGNVDEDDINVNTLNFLQTNPYFDNTIYYPAGPDIIIKSGPINDNGQIRNFRIAAGHDIQNVVGLAFEIEYDTSLFKMNTWFSRWPSDSQRLIYNDELPATNYYKVSFVQTDNKGISIDSLYSFNFPVGVAFQLKKELPVPDSTIIRLRNLIAVDLEGNDLLLGSYPLIVYKEEISGTSDQQPTKLIIYPNPANQSISIDTELEVDAHIYNLQGQHMMKIMAHDLHQSIDISPLPKGLYFLKFNKTGGTYKFVKQ